MRPVILSFPFSRLALSLSLSLYCFSSPFVLPLFLPFLAWEYTYSASGVPESTEARVPDLLPPLRALPSDLFSLSGLLLPRRFPSVR